LPKAARHAPDLTCKNEFSDTFPDSAATNKFTSVSSGSRFLVAGSVQVKQELVIGLQQTTGKKCE
jgi:hypothetical protein